MPVVVAHLFEHPGHRSRVAQLIHHAFWREVPGASAQAMESRLAQARDAHGIPLWLIALSGDEPIGVVNLVANDDEAHAEWTPWRPPCLFRYRRARFLRAARRGGASACA